VRLLVNNAGIEVVGNTWDLPAAVWERAIRVNVLGVIHGARAFLPAMIAAGQPAFIANLSSIGGVGMMPQQAPYIVSKHAVLSFSECLALELQLQAPHIHVSAVLPGPVTTRIFEDAPTGRDAASIAQHLALMKGMLSSQGMTPAEAAERIFEGIAARQFWVSTHPEMTRQMAQARAAYLAAQARPSMSADTLAILGR
jgi:NAD(P)-dependent dehydrogenase (short-subunit alcohol dehydrogenase family)